MEVSVIDRTADSGSFVRRAVLKPADGAVVRSKDFFGARGEVSDRCALVDRKITQAKDMGTRHNEQVPFDQSSGRDPGDMHGVFNDCGI
jgi:hypothetical protein